MADSPSTDLMDELLKKMNGTLSKLEEGQCLGNQRLGAIEHHMAGFHATVSSQHGEIEAIKDRLARLERRVEISD